MNLIPAGRHKVNFPEAFDNAAPDFNTVSGFEAFCKNLVAKIFCKDPKFFKFEDASGKNYWLEKNSAVNWIRSFEPNCAVTKIDIPQEIRQICAKHLGQDQGQTPLRTAKAQQVTDAAPKSGIKFCWAAIGNDKMDVNNESTLRVGAFLGKFSNVPERISVSQLDELEKDKPLLVIIPAIGRFDEYFDQEIFKKLFESHPKTLIVFQDVLDSSFWELENKMQKELPQISSIKDRLIKIRTDQGVNDPLKRTIRNPDQVKQEIEAKLKSLT